MKGDFEIWTEFFEDERFKALMEGKIVVNREDGTFYVLESQ